MVAVSRLNIPEPRAATAVVQQRACPSQLTCKIPRVLFSPGYNCSSVQVFGGRLTADIYNSHGGPYYIGPK